MKSQQPSQCKRRFTPPRYNTLDVYLPLFSVFFSFFFSFFPVGANLIVYRETEFLSSLASFFSRSFFAPLSPAFRPHERDSALAPRVFVVFAVPRNCNDDLVSGGVSFRSGRNGAVLMEPRERDASRYLLADHRFSFCPPFPRAPTSTIVALGY